MFSSKLMEYFQIFSGTCLCMFFLILLAPEYNTSYSILDQSPGVYGCISLIIAGCIMVGASVANILIDTYEDENEY